jgi:hypothetical protein
LAPNVRYQNTKSGVSVAKVAPRREEMRRLMQRKYFVKRWKRRRENRRTVTVVERRVAKSRVDGEKERGYGGWG